MDLDTLIARLQFLRTIHAGSTKVVLDDYYTPASLDTEDIYPESRGNVVGAETVLVIRS